MLACQTVASARNGGPREASETSAGVDYGSSMSGETRGLALCMQQRREEQAPQATLTARRPTERGPQRGLRAHNTSRPKRAAHTNSTHNTRAWPSQAPAPASPGL